MIPLAQTSELADGDRKSVFIDDVPCLLIRIGMDYFAVEDVCTHDGQPLTDGPVTTSSSASPSITCPRHGARFDLKTGKPLCMPAVQGLTTYGVLVRGDTIYGGTVEAVAKATAQAGAAPAQSTMDLPQVTTAGGTGAPGDWNTVRSAPKNPFAATPPGAASSSDASGGQSSPTEPGQVEAGQVEDGAIIEALRQVIDPELMINIVDLGLIYTINYSGEARSAQIEMTLTSPACPAGPQIIQQSKMSLEKIPGIDKAEIKLVMTPPWTPARMTDEARDMLGIF